MNKIRLKSSAESFPEDIDRIIKVMADHYYEVTRDQAKALWEEHSEDYAAGWLVMPAKDEDLFESLSRHFEKSGE